MTASTTSSPAPAAAAGPRAPTRRNAELALLLFAMGVVTVYAAAVEYGVRNRTTMCAPRNTTVSSSGGSQNLPRCRLTPYSTAAA